jgi:hypothetical protein
MSIAEHAVLLSAGSLLSYTSLLAPTQRPLQRPSLEDVAMTKRFIGYAEMVKKLGVSRLRYSVG